MRFDLAGLMQAARLTLLAPREAARQIMAMQLPASIGWLGMELFTSRAGGDAMAVTIWGASSSWTLTALPMFLWMGEILFRTRLSSDMFKGLAPWLESLPGRLLHVNVIGCTIFAAVSGSSVITKVIPIQGDLDEDALEDQVQLEAAYKEQLASRYGIVFNQLFALTNMPIQRFGSQLVSRHQFADYMSLLKGAYQEANLAGVMCRSLLSVSWQGIVHDCDFNQMLGLQLGGDSISGPARPVHIAELLEADLAGRPIRVADHCYGCTAGQGSSCGGALGAAESVELQPASS